MTTDPTDTSHTPDTPAPDSGGEDDPLDPLLPVAAVFLLALGGGVVAERTGSLLLGQVGALAALGAATLFLRREGRSWEELGFRRPGAWKPVLKWAVIGFLGIAVMTNVVMPLLYLLTPLAPREIPFFAGLRGSFPLALVYIAGGWILVALPEEMVVRGFILRRLAEMNPTAENRWEKAVVGQALLYGGMSAFLGAWAFTSATLAGLVLGWVYLKSGRNLWAGILAHGATHTMNVWLIYAGVFG